MKWSKNKPTLTSNYIYICKHSQNFALTTPYFRPHQIRQTQYFHHSTSLCIICELSKPEKKQKTPTNGRSFVGRVDSLHLYICYSIHIIVVITLLQRDVSTTHSYSVLVGFFQSDWGMDWLSSTKVTKWFSSGALVSDWWLVKCLSVCLWVLCVCAFLLCMGRTPPPK